MEKIETAIDGNWLRLDVKNDIRIGYPMFGSKEDVEKEIDNFAAALKKAINGQRISTLT